MQMGHCFSSSAAAATTSPHPPTAKIVAVDGTLREHTVPVSAAQALGRDHQSCFLCCSDMLFLDTYFPAMSPAESLVPDQIYFVLPVSFLDHPLTADDMMALAVKGGSALAQASEKHGNEERIRVKLVAEVDEMLDGGNLWSPRPRAVIKTIGRYGSVRGRMADQPCCRRSRLSTIQEVAE